MVMFSVQVHSLSADETHLELVWASAYMYDHRSIDRQERIRSVQKLRFSDPCDPLADLVFSVACNLIEFFSFFRCPRGAARAWTVMWMQGFRCSVVGQGVRLGLRGHGRALAVVAVVPAHVGVDTEAAGAAREGAFER